MKQRNKKLAPTKAYLEKAKKLSKDDAQRLMARMKGKFLRRYEDKRFTQIEALALQLQHEDEGLLEWRKKMAEIRSKHKA